MKFIRIRIQTLLLVPVLGLFIACEEPISSQGLGQYKTLVWAEEFEDASVDSGQWTFELGNNAGWGNNELEYYRAENATLEAIPGESAQALVITAKAESFGGQNFTSSRLKTQGKASWTYGRLEARMKLPEGQGIWPAFWMLGENISSVGWPRCGEIDIVEMVGGAGNKNLTNYGTVHWDDGGHQYRGGSVVLSSKLSADFHTYSIEWSADKILWAVDGTVFHSQVIDSASMDEFHKPAFLLLNLAVGGQWPGSPDGTTVLPQQFWVDWIRVYQ